MVLTYQKFDFENKCLIEKVIIQAPFRFSTSFHEEACFIYFAEGKTQINSLTGQELIQPEESVLLKCGNYFADLVKYPVSDRYEIIVFHLYADVLKKMYANEIPASIKVPATKTFIQKIASTDIIKKFIEGLYFYFDNPELVSDELLTLKIKELILLLLQTKNANSITSLFSDLFTPRSHSLREIVNSHIFSSLSIQDLAELSNMSLSTFNRTFQGLFNDTPANYIKNKRLERAKELLKISSLTVAEIASQTCFNDISHFSRSFKDAYNCSPTEYRSKIAER